MGIFLIVSVFLLIYISINNELVLMTRTYILLNSDWDVEKESHIEYDKLPSYHKMLFNVPATKKYWCKKVGLRNV